MPELFTKCEKCRGEGYGAANPLGQSTVTGIGCSVCKGKGFIPYEPELGEYLMLTREELESIIDDAWCDGYCPSTHPQDESIARLTKEARRLSAGRKDAVRERLEDWEDTAKSVMAEECAPDEKHCTCVPVLRMEIKRLREAAEDVWGSRRSKVGKSSIVVSMRALKRLEKALKAEGGGDD